MTAPRDRATRAFADYASQVSVHNAIEACITAIEQATNDLEADNSRLRRALEKYQTCRHGMPGCPCTEPARAALYEPKVHS